MFIDILFCILFYCFVNIVNKLCFKVRIHGELFESQLYFSMYHENLIPSGESLQDAIELVDAVAPPAYFAINCAHPDHFAHLLHGAAAWCARVRGIRANASTKSHAELDAATELDIGDPHDLARRYRGLRSALPNLNVLGGCCGTDWRHLRAVRDAWFETTGAAG